MTDDGNNSLTDDQMNVDFRTDPTFLPGVLKEVVEWESRLEGRGGDEEITVPVASISRLCMGMRAMYKSQTEVGFLGFGNNDRGDRGANCDYNPFNKINMGDF